MLTYPAHGCYAGYKAFSQIPLDVIFLCISHATMGEYLPLFRLYPRFQELGGLTDRSQAVNAASAARYFAELHATPTA